MAAGPRKERWGHSSAQACGRDMAAEGTVEGPLHVVFLESSHGLLGFSRGFLIRCAAVRILLLHCHRWGVERVVAC